MSEQYLTLIDGGNKTTRHIAEVMEVSHESVLASLVMAMICDYSCNDDDAFSPKESDPNDLISPLEMPDGDRSQFFLPTAWIVPVAGSLDDSPHRASFYAAHVNNTMAWATAQVIV